MKSTLLLLVLAIGISAQAQYKSKKNEVALYKGTEAQKNEDARLHFVFTGKVDKLIKNVGEAHRGTFSKAEAQEDGIVRYYAENLGYPDWIFGMLNVYVEVEETKKETIVRIYHTYYRKDYNITGTTLGENIEEVMVKFYQKVVDESL